MRKALVLGLGISGEKAALFLLDKGFSVYLYDDNSDRVIGLKGRLPKAHLDQILHYESGVEIDLLVVSPGVPRTHFIYQGAIEKGVDIVG